MSKFLTLVALVVSCASINASVGFAETPATSDEMPGQLIDDLMQKSVKGKVTTAEGALPSKDIAPMKSESKNNIEATQPVFNNAATIGNTTKTQSSSLWGRMLMSLVILGVLLGGGYLAYRRWPGAQKMVQRAKMIEILSQQYLGPKRSLAVVRVAGEAVLVGITDNNITLLKTLSLLDDDVPVETRDAKFSLKKSEDQKFKNTLGAKVEEVPSREDEFSMEGLKDFIGDRLKNMRNLS